MKDYQKFQKYSLPNIKTPSGYYSNYSIIVLNGLVIITGVIYIFFQWNITNIIVDSLFVSMLLGATMILLLGMRIIQNYIINRGLHFYMFTMPKEEPDVGYKKYIQLCKSVFNFKKMTFVGVIYGCLVGSVPFILDIWEENMDLKILLTLFMFFVNFVTGIGFYGLTAFFYHSIKMGRLVKVDLWQVENPSTNFLLGASRRIALIASLYISICISSIIFSKIPIGNLVIGYSIFSAIIILSCLIIPSYPIAQRMREQKIIAIQDIGEQLQQCYYETLELVKSGSEVNFNKFEHLLQIREKIDSINSWPFKIKSLTAGLYVVFFSSIPLILQVVLEKIIK